MTPGHDGKPVDVSHTEKLDSEKHDWKRIPGSNVSYVCSKCGTIGNLSVHSPAVEGAPVTSVKASCEAVVTAAVMES